MYTITTSAGTTIEITYSGDYLPGVPKFRIEINGQVVAKGATIPQGGRPIQHNGKTIVAALDIAGGKQVGLTAEDVEALRAEADANRSDKDRAELAMSRLRRERQGLVSDINSLVAAAAPADLYDSEYEDVNLRRQRAAKEAEAKIPAARAALDAFDAEHPEIIEVIHKERQESIERNRWN